ncbi:hypothetical protein JZ751_008574 [Albula glossodonta]|uniref:Uncharacterized protein n=1 Tax=Albula glossodonta TaxID=121402 RepID=A0A8T2P135_9TELE|nr:hypothetical protein JZ751_008574 [Albula glossodonta]
MALATDCRPTVPPWGGITCLPVACLQRNRTTVTPSASKGSRYMAATKPEREIHVSSLKCYLGLKRRLKPATRVAVRVTERGKERLRATNHFYGDDNDQGLEPFPSPEWELELQNSSLVGLL